MPIFELAEERGADAERMKRILSIPAFHKVMDRYLPRYYLAALTPGSLKLLESKELAARRAAILFATSG